VGSFGFLDQGIRKVPEPKNDVKYEIRNVDGSALVPTWIGVFNN